MSDESTRSSERVVVVGGGVIGLATTYELLRRGCEVMLLERESFGCGATWAAAGMLAPVSEAEIDSPAVVGLGRDSLSRYGGFVRGLEELTGVDCGYRSEGTLWVALDRNDLAELQHLAETLDEKGLAADPLDAGTVREIEPHLSHRVSGGLLVQGDHQVDPRALSLALEAGARKLGGGLRTGAAVDELMVQDGCAAGVRGSARDGSRFEIDARRVVLAAGAWSANGIRSPFANVGLRPVKGQLVRLRGAPLLSRVVRTPQAYMVPRCDGDLLVGATMEEMGFDTEPTAGAVLDLLRHAWEALPGAYDLGLAEVSVGLRSAVDDHHPVIGETGVRGLFAAFGHYRNGVLLAPATAQLLAEWIETGGRPVELRPFLPERLSRLDAAPAG